MNWKKKRHQAVSSGADGPFPLTLGLVIKAHMLLTTEVVESLIKTVRGSETNHHAAFMNQRHAHGFSCTEIAIKFS